MYKVYCDGVAIYDLYSPDLMLLDPVLKLELNSPGSFEFTIPLDHPYYDLPQEMLSRVWIIKDDEEIFRGRIIGEDIDWYKRKKIYCEGELAFLNDSIQRPAEYHDMTVYDYFKTLIENHNAQVEEDKQFEVGYVLVEDSNDSLYRYTNYNSTMTEMKEDLIDDLGGYIRVRNQNGHRYLDYINIEDYGTRNDQAIRFGINLLDFTQTMDVEDIATVVIPLGERLEESPIEALDMRLTIESVNGGSDAIESEEAVKTYGRIVQTVIWDGVTIASNLLEKGKKYLSDYQWDPLVLEITPVDLHDSDPDTESFNLGDQLRVISSPHGLDRYFPLSAMTIYLDALDKNTFTLGTEIAGKTLTDRVKTTTDTVEQVKEEITPTQTILNQARQQASNLITSATHGYVVMQPNDKPEELLIMDTDDITTAQQVWRWNMGGLGFSSTGYNGDYGHAAITMDGMINADYILTGSLTANIITAGILQDAQKNNSWNLDTGLLTTKNIEATGGTIGGWSITSTRIRSSANVSIHGGVAGILLINEDNKPFIDAEDDEGNTTFSIARNGKATFAGALSGATGTFKGSLSAATGTFAGSLSAANGTFSGTLSAVSGSFTSIYTGSHSSFSSTKNGVYAGTDGFSVGSNLSIDNTGTITAKSLTLSGSNSSLTLGTKFKVNKAGELYAHSPRFVTYLYMAIDPYTSASNRDVETDYTYDRVFSYNYSDSWTNFVVGNSSAQQTQFYGKNTTINLGSSSNYIHIYDYDCTYVQGNLYAFGTFGCSSTKSRIVDTKDFGTIAQYCYETASPYFGDMGEGLLDENGECFVFLDEMFLETIEGETKYLINLTPTDEKGVYVDYESISSDGFIVRGTPNSRFYWEVKAKQKDYSNTRLEYWDTDEHEDYAREEELINEANEQVKDVDSILEAVNY